MTRRRPMATPKQPEPVFWRELLAGIGFVGLLVVAYVLLALIAA